MENIADYDRHVGPLSLFSNQAQRLGFLAVLAFGWILALAVSCIAEPGFAWSSPRSQAVIALFGVFAIALVGNLTGIKVAEKSVTPKTWVLLQFLAMLGITMLSMTAASVVLLVLLASQLPTAFRFIHASIALATANIIVALIVAWRFGATELLQHVVHLGFQLFAFFAMTLAAAHRSGHMKLRESARELRAMQAVLLQSERQNERLRISRDLHDALGHKLTALSLRMELASMMNPSGAAFEIKGMRDLCQSLSADIRNAVTNYRNASRTELRDLVQTVSEHFPDFAIRLFGGEHMLIENGTTIETIIRLLQEMVTNAVKHGGANELMVDVTADAHVVRFEMRDNGKGCQELVAGYGLTGMLERIEALGGRFDASIVDDRLHTTLTIPQSQI